MVKCLEPLTREPEEGRVRKGVRWELHVKEIYQRVTEVVSIMITQEVAVWFGFSFLAGGGICQMTSEPCSFGMKIGFWLNLAVPDLYHHLALK